MKFTKMHGAGNDYVFLDCFQNPPLPEGLPQLARDISDRHCGVGADGLILIHPSHNADARMQMFNADGTEAEMCGNGIRCLAKYVYDHGICQKPQLLVDTGAGVLSLELEINQGLVSSVSVDMGPPILAAEQIPTTLVGDPVADCPLEVAGQELLVSCVSMGNPHCIVFVDQLTDELVRGLGPQIETHPCFPARVNVEFVEVLGRQEVRQRTWERGSGETMACGTGASAVCVAGVLTDRTDEQITNHLLGGDLSLRWDPSSKHVFMTGQAVEVFQGEWPS